MSEVTYLNRRAVRIENEVVRVTVTVEGGHVAEIVHKPTGVNPLWTPHWTSIEPSAYDPARHPEYGLHREAQLLAGILGHNICLDTFGAPSEEEAAAGMPVHGEASLMRYEVAESYDEVTLAATLGLAQLRFERKIRLRPDSTTVHFLESVENLSASDRPIGWTEHVTLGAPFLEAGATQFRLSATRSKVIGDAFNNGKGNQQPHAEFAWPLCPLKDGETSDLRVFTAEKKAGGFTAHLMDPNEKHAWFGAWSPRSHVLFGYAWNREDFPWLARWEEKNLRTGPPWNGQGFACGMEFGVSPFVESRRGMVTRGSLFGVPTFRWLPALSRVTAEYCAFITTADSIPERVVWDGRAGVGFEL